MTFHAVGAPPPPPPAPPPHAAPRAQRTAVQPQALPVPQQEIVAPAVIPDLVPVLEPQPMIAPEPETVAEDNRAAEGVDEGVPAGVPGGVAGGQIGGVLGGELGGVAVDDGRLHVQRDVPLKGMTVLAKLYPEYPIRAINSRWEDELVVRYVIGMNGRVKEVTIIVPPQHKEFEAPTLRAIRTWRFRPLIQDGQKREVVHELTVRFRLNW